MQITFAGKLSQCCTCELSLGPALEQYKTTRTRERADATTPRHRNEVRVACCVDDSPKRLFSLRGTIKNMHFFRLGGAGAPFVSGNIFGSGNPMELCWLRMPPDQDCTVPSSW